MLRRFVKEIGSGCPIGEFSPSISVLKITVHANIPAFVIVICGPGNGICHGFEEIKEFWPKKSRLSEKIDEARLNLRRRVRGDQHGIT